MKKRIPNNEFLCVKRDYANFELRLKLSMPADKGNAGIQIRSRRIPNHHGMIGYQADVGSACWGALYDESRRRKMLAKPTRETLKKAVKPHGWNEYVIRCEGKRIQIWLNGVQTVDYTEADDKIPQTGIIGLRIHGGAPSEVWYKDIEIVSWTSDNHGPIHEPRRRKEQRQMIRLEVIPAIGMPCLDASSWTRLYASTESTQPTGTCAVSQGRNRGWKQ